MKRDMIHDVLARETAGGEVTVMGWARAVRAQKNVIFLQLNDGSVITDLQAVVAEDHPDFERLRTLGVGAALRVTGELADSAGKGQRFEIKAAEVVVHGDADPGTYPLQKKRHSFEFLREKLAHLRPRAKTFGAVFRVRNVMAHAIHTFFQERGFVWVHTPIITASDAEGAGEMFRVTTLDAVDPPRTDSGAVDYDQDFFARPTFLTVSGQLEAELFALALSNVYTFGPTFRAENSNTSRHLAEFWMVEPELAFCDIHGDMDLAEAFLKHLFRTVLERCPEDMDFFSQYVDKSTVKTLEHIVESEFERLTYTEAVRLLEGSGQSFEYPIAWGRDLQAEHERYLCEQKIGRPVILTDYPKDIKAFYMRLNDDDKTVRGMDVLVPRLGEIIGGSQREERLDVLERRIGDCGLDASHYWWYLDTRRFGTVEHAGFGLGFERTVQFVTGMANIRDVIPFPRTPRSADY
ncbi:MAG: asparagine--tRNA ligase [bacterium]